MEIRPIKQEEKVLKDKIQSIAFLFKKDFSSSETSTLESQDGYKTGRAAFNEHGKMCSCFDLIPFQVSFNGSCVPMGGIGGVASLPEERDKKYIRNIFEYSMKEMYENGTIFSYLYPFSHTYYRKFGYELNMTNIIYSIPTTAFKHFKQTGELKLHTNEMNPEPIISLYEEYIKDKNLAVFRTEKLWKRFLEKDPYKDNVYLYIWTNHRKVAKGYLQFHTEKLSNGKNSMQVQELIWLDREAFTGIFSFIGSLTAQMEKMVWKAPSFVNLLPLFPEPYDIKQEVVTYGMNRIVNVEKALGLMPLPEGSGEIIAGVEDGFFPLNTGNYSISWENNTRKIARTQKAPDLTCDVQALSQLITGFATVDDLILADRIVVNRNKNLLSQLFSSKMLFINNYF